MKSKFLTIFVLAFCSTATTLLAQPSYFSSATLIENPERQNNFDESEPSLLILNPSPLFYLPNARDQQTEIPEKRSVAKAVLMSTVIPGTGQFYNKSFLKSLLFLGVEIGGWVAYGVYTDRGNEKTDAFESYADAHWFAEQYWAWIDQASGCSGDINCQKKYERENFSHFLPDEKNQTYYENIGKYNQFNVGWDDTDSGGSHARDSANREVYVRIRQDANDQYKTATIGVTVVLFNHILSAIDAGLTTYRYNRNLEASMGMDMQKYDQELVPALSLRMRW